MNVFAAQIVSRPSKNADGLQVESVLVGTVGPFVANNADIARTKATALIAQTEALAIVLGKPESYQVQLVQANVIATF